MAQAATSIVENLVTGGTKQALVFSKGAAVNYDELRIIVEQALGLLRKKGVGFDDGVLLGIPLSPELYALVIACSLIGAKVILVEPWMPLAAIEGAINLVKPKIFITGGLGRLWGVRVKAIRHIPYWVGKSSIHQTRRETLAVPDFPDSHPCLITFTTGTTGVPKGVVRTHSYLGAQAEVITKSLGTAKYRGSDLVVFANLALLNLGVGRTSLIMSNPWGTSDWKWLHSISGQDIESTVCGPAFLHRLIREVPLSALKAMFVGGALADCSLYEAAISRWPDGKLIHVYGSTEVEPVSYVDFKTSVNKSRSVGHFQTSFLGPPTPEITLEGKGLLSPAWVSGCHVAGEYLGDSAASNSNKKRDQKGVLWHRMGDQIFNDPEGNLWYRGRDGQGEADFQVEQRLYHLLGHSRAFIYENTVVGEGVSQVKRVITSTFPHIKDVREGRIYRDRRHHARIDRTTTLARLK